jgi:phytoene dehydrogenase-like protein
MARRATVIGSGPNGLSAAVTLARAGYDVRVVEASDTVGGGVRTSELTLSGYRHDVCSAVHPAALTSPFFRAFGLRERIEWHVPEAAFAQPFADGSAAIAWRDLDRTATGLGADGPRWQALVGGLSRRLDDIVDATSDQLIRMPRHPLATALFGVRTLQHAYTPALSPLRTAAGRALLTGVLAHANTRLPSFGAAAAGLLLAAHAHHGDGWAFPHGGAQAIADTLVEDLRAHGGTVEAGALVRSLTDLDLGDPDAGDVVLLNTSPRLALTHPDTPPAYARAIGRYRYGAAAAKVDFALSGPVPWSDPDVSHAPTVHLGGTADEVRAGENAVAAGRIAEHPYVLVVQPSVMDTSRAPSGHGVLWAYLHVPPESTFDPTEAVLAQLERVAPGVRDLVVASTAMTAREREDYNPSDIGGDILGGAFSLTQALRRPVVSRSPWRTPMRGVYLASASTPPGPGVTGMPGWHAARTVLADAGQRVSLDDLFS